MRRFFIFLFLSFASLFFSQCKIGKIFFFIDGKVEAANKNERKGNKDEKVGNVNLKELKNINNITPSYKKISSDMSDRSSYSEVSTTVSKKNSCINAGHNVDKKESFYPAKMSDPKCNLIHSFNGAKTDGEGSYDEKEIIQKPDTYFVGKERVGRDGRKDVQGYRINNINYKGGKLKRKDYYKLIAKKIKKQDDKAGTLSLVRGGEGSSIFVQRKPSIESNKIFQEAGDKKDVHKYLHILPKNNSGQLVRKDKRNNAEKLRKSPTHKNNLK